MDGKHPKKCTPKKVFILENGAYIEITYEELCERRKRYKDYETKLFLPLHGMLMEVTENVYREFYREEERQKYLKRRAEKKGEVSYDALTSDEFNGENIIVDQSPSVEEIVETRMMYDKLDRSLKMLTEDELSLLEALFYRGLSEYQWSAISGIPQTTIGYRKRCLLAKLKKIMKNM